MYEYNFIMVDGTEITVFAHNDHDALSQVDSTMVKSIVKDYID